MFEALFAALLFIVGSIVLVFLTYALFHFIKLTGKTLYLQHLNRKLRKKTKNMDERGMSYDN